MPSIKDIAREAGVSVSTVSLVLNNKGRISEETRNLVMKVVHNLNYTPNTQARNLRNQETRVIGYAQPAWISDENIIYSRFLQQISNQLEKTDRYLLVFHEKHENDLDTYQKLIDSQRVDGFILSFTQRDDERFHFLKAQDIPFVAFGRSLTQLDYETFWVDVDNQQGMYDLTLHLIERGHRRIGMISWEEGSWVSDLRIRGYRQALNDAGIAFNPALLRRTEDTAAMGYENARLLLESDTPPTAICAVSDLIGVGALRYIEEHKLRVAVTGFDDNPISRLITPMLTTVRQPLIAVAQKIPELMIAQLEDPEAEPRSYLFTPDILIRASSNFRVD